MGHESARRRAVPVIFTRFKEDRVSWPDLLDRPAAALTSTDPLSHIEGVTVRVGVPRRPRARREVHIARVQSRLVRRRRDSIDIYRAGDPLARADPSFECTLGDLHVLLRSYGATLLTRAAPPRYRLNDVAGGSSFGQSLQVFRITGPLHCDLCGGALDVAEIVRREFDFGGADVLGQPLQFPGTWDWGNPRLLGKQPSKRDLSG